MRPACYLTKEKRYDMINAFNSTSRHLGDLLIIDNIHFEQMVPLNFNLTKLMLLIPKQPFQTYTYRFIIIQLLQLYMINGMILILKFSIFCSLMAMSFGIPLMLHIYLILLALPEHLRMLMSLIIVTNSCLPNSLSKTIGIINSAKHFPNFFRRRFELIEKNHVNLKKLLQQGISNSMEICFSDLYKRIVNRFRRAWYTLDIMRQTACLVLTQSWF